MRGRLFRLCTLALINHRAISRRHPYCTIHRFISSIDVGTQAETDVTVTEAADVETIVHRGYLSALTTPTVSHHRIFNHPITITPLPVAAPTFHHLFVAAPLQSRLTAAEYKMPTVIQAASIPFLSRKPTVSPTTGRMLPRPSFPDLLISDGSSSGKTLAYLIPALSQIDSTQSELQCVVVAPTRELATQIHRVAVELNTNKRIRIISAVGSLNPFMSESVTREKPHVLVGTPHVLHEILCQQRLIDPRWLKYLIFDEIDALQYRKDCRPYMRQLAALKSKLSHTQLSLPNPRIDMEQLNDDQLQLVSLHPRTQVVLVGSTLTPAVFSFAKSNLSTHFHLITPLSVPGECARRRHRAALIASTSTTLAAHWKLSDRVQHYGMIVRPVNKPTVLLELLQAIHLHWKSHRPDVLPIRIRVPLPPQRYRAYQHALHHQRPSTSALRSGLQSIDPAYAATQTTIVYIRQLDDLRALVSPLSACMRVGILTSYSSRAERREALTGGRCDVILTNENLCGLDLRTATHVVFYDTARSTTDYVHLTGRIVRRGAVHTSGGMAISMVTDEDDYERLQRLGQSMGISVGSARVGDEKHLFLNKSKRPPPPLQHSIDGRNEQRRMTATSE